MSFDTRLALDKFHHLTNIIKMHLY